MKNFFVLLLCMSAYQVLFAEQRAGEGQLGALQLALQEEQLAPADTTPAQKTCMKRAQAILMNAVKKGQRFFCNNIHEIALMVMLYAGACLIQPVGALEDDKARIVQHLQSTYGHYAADIFKQYVEQAS